jgi:hypothetical protein
LLLWRLEQRNEQCGTIASRLLLQRLQRIQLLVEPLGSLANSGFYDLG